MYNYIAQRTPLHQRAEAIQELETGVKDGSIDLVSTYADVALDRQISRYSAGLKGNIALSGVAGVGLLLTGFGELVAAGAGAACAIAMIVDNVSRHARAKRDIMDGDILPYLGEEGKEELFEYLEAAKRQPERWKPAQKSIERVYQAFKMHHPDLDDAIDAAATTVDAVATPVEDTAQPPLEGAARQLSHQDILNFVYNELTLVWGQAGSAKTTAVMAMGNYAASKDWRVMVGDPHYKLGSWPKFKVFKTHDECNLMLQGVKSECDRRYQLRRTEGKDEDDFEPWLVILEEFTNWASKCEKPSDFIVSAIQDFRKANIHVLIVSHARTLAGLGNPKSFSESFHNGCVELNLLAHSTDTPKGRKSRPTGEGKVRIQGGAEELVEVPDFRELKFSDFPDQSDYRFGFENSFEASSQLDGAHSNADREPELLPGTTKTLEEACECVYRYISTQKVGKTLTAKGACGNFTSGQKDKFENYFEMIGLTLQKKYSQSIIFKKNRFGEWTICYQEPHS